MSYPKVVIVILNWNGKKDTLQCLEAINHLEYNNFEIVVVDNGSTDGSVEFLKRQKVIFIDNKRNVGFAAGNNVGMRVAFERKADYILLLNNDTDFDPFCLTHMVKTAESLQEIGVVSPKIYYYDDKEKIWSIGGNNIFKTVILGDPVKGKQSEGRCQQDMEVDYVWSCAMLIKREVIEKVGFLDEDYFVSMEDIDYCKRAKDSGFKIYLSSAARLFHKVSSSMGGDNYTPTLRYFYGKGMILFLKKHAGFWQWVIACLIIFISIIWAIPRELLRNNHKAVFAKIKGIKDGLKMPVSLIDLRKI